MSTHYVDIRILPDPEFSHVHLLSALYAKFHRALVQSDIRNIGISFPGYSLRPRGLGEVFRLHGTEAALNTLLATDWLRGMRDHVDMGTIQKAPSRAEHRQLLRRQFKTNVERMRRRRMRRMGETYEQTVDAIPDTVERQPDLPYITLRSGSTGQSFCLFLVLSDPRPGAVDGEFNSYGLSRKATVPWF